MYSYNKFYKERLLPVALAEVFVQKIREAIPAGHVSRLENVMDAWVLDPERDGGNPVFDFVEGDPNEIMLESVACFLPPTAEPDPTNDYQHMVMERAWCFASIRWRFHSRHRRLFKWRHPERKACFFDYRGRFVNVESREWSYPESAKNLWPINSGRLPRDMPICMPDGTILLAAGNFDKAGGWTMLQIRETLK